MARRDGRRRVSSTTRERSQQLRKYSTYPEQRLWSELRGRMPSGVRFRRQHPIEPYIVDFYCASARLAVELDGESHNGREEYDQRRTQYLEDQSVRILRFTNDDVLTNLDGILELIAQAVRIRSVECCQGETGEDGCS